MPDIKNANIVRDLLWALFDCLSTDTVDQMGHCTKWQTTTSK